MLVASSHCKDRALTRFALDRNIPTHHARELACEQSRWFSVRLAWIVCGELLPLNGVEGGFLVCHQRTDRRTHLSIDD
jgi:hypothetical protein